MIDESQTPFKNQIGYPAQPCSCAENNAGSMCDCDYILANNTYTPDASGEDNSVESTTGDFIQKAHHAKKKAAALLEVSNAGYETATVQNAYDDLKLVEDDKEEARKSAVSLLAR